MKIKLRPFNKEGIDHVIKNARPIHHTEAKAFLNLDLESAVNSEVKNSSFGGVFYIDEEPVAITGVVKSEAEGTSVGLIWMITTESFFKASVKQIYIISEQVINYYHTHFHILTGLTLKDNLPVFRWLTNLGCTFIDNVINYNGYQFKQFVKYLPASLMEEAIKEAKETSSSFTSDQFTSFNMTDSAFNIYSPINPTYL